MAGLSRIFCARCPVPAVLLRLSCLNCPFPAVPFFSNLRPSCPDRFVLPYLSLQSFPSFLVRAPLPGLSISQCPVPEPADLFLLSCSGHFVTSDLPRLTWPGGRGQADVARRTWPGGRGQADVARPTCPGRRVQAELFRLTCPGWPVRRTALIDLFLLFRKSCPICRVTAVPYRLPCFCCTVLATPGCVVVSRDCPVTFSFLSFRTIFTNTKHKFLQKYKSKSLRFNSSYSVLASMLRQVFASLHTV